MSSDAEVLEFHMSKKHPDKSQEIVFQVQQTIPQVTKTELFHCKTCKSEFDSKELLLIHSKSHEKQHKCSNCEEKFDSEEKLANHSKSHQPKQNFSCDYCDKKFEFQSPMKVHIEMVHKNKIKTEAKDDTGKKSVQTKNQTPTNKNYKPNSGSRKKLKCNQCPYFAFKEEYLNQHVQTIHKFYKCDFCGKQFGSKNDLSAHVTGVHYQMSSLEKKSDVTPNKNQIHAPTSTENSSKIKCCNIRFERQRDFQQHVKHNHSSKQPSVSSTNGNSETTPKVDKRTPSTKSEAKEIEKMHKCNFCDSEFRIVESLISHQKHFHSQKQTYKCEKCDKTFTTDNLLKYHVKVNHTENTVTKSENKLQCQYCVFSCNIKKNFDLHFKSHHEKELQKTNELKEEDENNLKCDICNKEFSIKFKFNMHMKKVHKKP